MSELTVVFTPDQCVAGIRDHAISEHAHKVVQGWYLMHAQQAFSMPQDSRGQGRKTSATVALDYANAENPGFDAWIAEHCAGLVSRRTVFNYITAATRAGLTLDMTPEAALAQARTALAAVARLSDLYQLPESKHADPAKSPPGAPHEQAQQLLLPLMDEISRSFVEGSAEERALYLAPLETVEALETKLRTALDMIRAVRTERAKPTASRRRK